MNRENLKRDLQNNLESIWDIIVIGGGATGLGIALDGATRGYKTLLLEQSDFAKATSSRSTKLVHGGVRYLAHGDLLLVREALHERGIMLKNAPHLTYNQEFIIPCYSYWDAVLYTLGLTFYDLLSGRLSLGKSYFIGRNKIIKRLPVLNVKGLKGGVVYHDGKFDDTRMACSMAKSCIDAGGIVLNYFKVTGFNKNEQGIITGVEAEDLVSGVKHHLKSHLVINATGVFADEVMKLNDINAKPSIKPSQGVHIVLDKSFLKSNSGIMIPKTSDGRVLFLIPWYDEVIIGTTDTPIDTISLEPIALKKEIDFILQTAEKYLTRAPKIKDIKSVFAGLRPLAANPDNPLSTKEVSRRHKIILSSSGLLTIIGGKWTTYREMAQETIDMAITKGFLKKKKCVTNELKLTNLQFSDFSNCLHIYGDGMHEIQNMINQQPELGLVLDSRLPYTKAEIIWICRNEMPVTIEDILARRTRALFLNASASVDIASEISSIMAIEHGHDENWQKSQVESFCAIAKNYSGSKFASEKRVSIE